ncbi:rhodanese-like domain-containing protein [Desulfosoma caldarium]|uniref:Rhodanese-related sulfurtransferase n=1 Tax=Desulfosoma caldarium TaxID=610254 RepID=A0A3N1URL4_9BACT|nr:rhodanese-like domain-containing protein [Desulfosoma caldarium]ROQ92039.1 rhodanese-related sulfurtransferase [Desulfosoma caldarium]
MPQKSGTAQAVESLFIDELETYRAQHREKDYELIDVREPAEYAAGHIPGARLMPLSRFEKLMRELDPSKELLFYCASGGRSMAAALMAAESDLKPARVINLQGGYMAWDGKELLDFPKVRLLADKASLADMLQEAMNLEKGAFRFYTLSSAQEFAWADTAQKLVEWERRHAQAVYRLLEASPRHEPLAPFDDLFASLSGTILEGGESLEEAVKKMQSLPVSSCYAFAELALDIEYRAYDLYRNAAATAKDAAASEILRDLAEQEKAHLSFIAKVFAACSGEAS